MEAASSWADLMSQALDNPDAREDARARLRQLRRTADEQNPSDVELIDVCIAALDLLRKWEHARTGLTDTEIQSHERWSGPWYRTEAPRLGGYLDRYSAAGSEALPVSHPRIFPPHSVSR